MAPPPEPAQLQVHGPLPLTVDAVPAVQRLAVGVLVRSAPFEEPHAPLTFVVDASLSEHDAVLPPLLPAQVHDHGPLHDGDTARARPVAVRLTLAVARRADRR